MKALKRYGQNFLVDRNILGVMIAQAGLTENDCVLEIGPGHGVLTRAILAEKVKCLHCVELDERLRPELEEIHDGRLSLHWGDAVKYDYSSLAPFPGKVIANIPYKITTPLIWELIKFADKGLRYMLLMLQKEAAERITAPADTRARYPLGVCIEAVGKAKAVRSVPPQCFRPAPKVYSAIVEIEISRNFELAGSALWSRMLHLGFAHRRKTLANNLKGWALPEGIGEKRAEDLSADEWIKIYSSAQASHTEESVF
ncbi:MAG: ribosomal RNA small subunit methyltransferase A [Synergistaceae bacterium]|nr:ribosomal RNA small subunit methyltransferase A [Synergistaceae bacterium]